jgi:8-oxo-dGTP diphosphatase
VGGYCFRCGTGLVEQALESRARLVCPACGWVYYPQLKVSAAALLEKDGKLLLVRRKQEPWAGYWYLPAGYVEADEDPSLAAERELFEETGLHARAEEVFGVYFFDDDPRGNGLLVVYRCRDANGVLAASRETEKGEYFGREELPALLTGAGHERAIADWLKADGRASR